MKLAIIAENKIYKNVLSKALSVVGQDVRTYAYGDRTYKAEDCDITICVISESTMLEALIITKTKECFAILEKNFVNPPDSAPDSINEFLAVFQAPVRLGAIIEAILSYLKQRQQRELLKPISLGKFSLDPMANELNFFKGGAFIKLTEKEQDILLYLYAHKEAAVSRQNLLDHVWGYVEGVETHTLETHIYRLRQKVEEDPTAPNFLMTNEDGYYLNL